MYPNPYNTLLYISTNGAQDAPHHTPLYKELMCEFSLSLKTWISVSFLRLLQGLALLSNTTSTQIPHKATFFSKASVHQLIYLVRIEH